MAASSIAEMAGSRGRNACLPVAWEWGDGDVGGGNGDGGGDGGGDGDGDGDGGGGGGGDGGDGGDGVPVQTSRSAASTANGGDCGSTFARLTVPAGVDEPSIGLIHSPVQPLRFTLLPKPTPVVMFVLWVV